MTEVGQEFVILTLDDKHVSVSKNKLKGSDLYGSVMNHYESMQVPTSVAKEAFDDYVQWITSDKNNKKQKLKSCFEHCSLIGHDEYLRHCVQKLLKHYNEYKDVLDELNENVKRDIYLNFPLLLIPDHIRQDLTFLSHWMKNIYYYHNGEEFIVNTMDRYSHTVKYDTDANNVKYLYSFANFGSGSKRHGLHLSFHVNGLKAIETNYNHNQVSHERKWSKNGILLSEYTQIDDLVGISRHWYESGRLRCICHYKQGKKDGDTICYYDEENEYDSSPKVYEHQVWQMGKLLSQTLYDKDDWLQPPTSE